MSLLSNSKATCVIIPSLLATIALLAGCPKPTLSDPEPIKAAKLLGRESVDVVQGNGRPLVVDWQGEQRADLEVSMKQGVAVVAYDSKGLRLLNDCRLDGDYGFVGFTRKEQVLELATADEVRANLPFGGLGIVAKLGAQLGTETAVKIATVMIGQRRTTWGEASVGDLQGGGKCAGATHFVRGATIGAFSLRSLRKTTQSSVAEVFGIGAGAAASQSSAITNTDGTLNSCQQANPEGDKPPPQCGALIRLELVELGKARTQKTTAAAAQETESCPQGYVYADGKCTREKEIRSHVCRPGDVADCTSQCDQGNAGSCNNLGVAYFQGANVARDTARAATLFRKACDASLSDGCLNLGYMLAGGAGVPADRAGAVRLFEQACGQGNPNACWAAGDSYGYGEGVPQDYGRAALLLGRACEAGAESACNNFANLLQQGHGVAKDIARANRMYKRACDGRIGMSCQNLGTQYERGRGTTPNPALALRYYELACKLSDETCAELGMARLVGTLSPADERAGADALRRSCGPGKDPFACAFLNLWLGERTPTTREDMRLRVVSFLPSCQTSEIPRFCSYVGVAAMQLGKRQPAEVVFTRACLLGDAMGCEVLKKLRMNAPPKGTQPPAAPTMADLGFPNP